MNMEAIDRKFEFEGRCTEHDHIYTHFEGVLFLAKDRAFLAVLPDYRRRCEELGVGSEQLQGIDLLIQRVERYQREHPDKVKIPDVDPVLGAHILRPNAP
jgi:hypothetical protein